MALVDPQIHNRYRIEFQDLRKGTFKYWEDRARASHNGHDGKIRASSFPGMMSVDFLTGPLAGNSIRIPIVQIIDEYNSTPPLTDEDYRRAANDMPEKVGE